MDTITNNKITDLPDRTKKDDASPKRIILFSVLFFSLFIGFFPNLGKYCQRTVCQQAHQKKALIWIHYVDLTHFAAGQDLLDLLQEMAISRIRIILCHLLRDHKKLQRDQIKPLHRKFMVQDIVDPLAAEALLAEMLCQNGCGHLFEISHFINGDPAADNLSRSEALIFSGFQIFLPPFSSSSS